MTEYVSYKLMVERETGMFNRNMLELTPDKSKVVKTKGAIKIVYINKVGTVKRREECVECKHIAKVQLGLGYGMGLCCDQPENGWEEFNGHAVRKCKLFEAKENKED